jgi:molybdopterin biosynthesis enzyme
LAVVLPAVPVAALIFFRRCLSPALLAAFCSSFQKFLDASVLASFFLWNSIDAWYR